MFKSSSASAQEHLRRLRERHRESWSSYPVPEWSVQPSWRLESFLKMGLGSRETVRDARIQNLEALRVAALRADAPFTVHALLLQEGLPVMSKSTASKEAARVLDSAQCRSLQVIYKEQPEVIIRSITRPPGIGALKAVGRFLNRPSIGAVRMLEILDAWGADWDMKSVEDLVNRQPEERQKRWRIMRHLLLKARMEKALPEQGSQLFPRARF